MPSSQPPAAAGPASDQRRSDKTVTQEPPKLKTPLKTPPKQATNPLQFVKVGPCSLYRSAQEQLSKVQEVKKVETKVKDDPEDWQSNLDNWKSSRRKRQEHIIERVVEVKKLELEEHDRNRKRTKTLTEMMEERGRKLSLSLAVYNEDDANDLSDLGIGTSSGKSSVSGDTHDDSHSVLSDRDSEIDKSHSDMDNAVTHENGNSITRSNAVTPTKLPTPTMTNKPITPKPLPLKREVFNNGFHKNNGSGSPSYNSPDYDSATTATTSSPEPDEYTRNYVSRISQGFSQNGTHDDKRNDVEVAATAAVPVVKVDILKRREIFEKAARENESRINSLNNNGRVDFGNTKSIKERLSILERQKSDNNDVTSVKSPRHSVEKQEIKTRDLLSDELESVKPLREILSNLEKCNMQDLVTANAKVPATANHDELNAKFIKERLISLDAARCKDMDKRTNVFYPEQANNRAENLTPSERSSSPDSEYRAPRATFHQSLDSLDADASSGPDTFERVQSLEELDYHQSRRYPASSSSAEILNDTDREDSGIHTADASCSVSQADEPIEEEPIEKPAALPIMIVEEKTEFRSAIESALKETSKSLEKVEEKISGLILTEEDERPETCGAVLTELVKPADEEPQNKVEVEKDEAEVEEEEEVEEEREPEAAVEVEEPQEKKNSSMDEIAMPTPPAPVRPTTLALERTTLHEPEFLSPLSPVTKPILPLSFSSDEEIVTGLSFPLGPPTSVEPPKEKPPPPPVDLSDEENHPIEPLKRLNSTRRIKKELRNRRSDFLGIEGFNDEELETLTRPPDMAAILAEERRIEQLHRRSYDTDSNYEQDSSHERDSGVELGQAEDWTKQPVSPDMSQHSRQSSEPFGASVTSSEEDEITKKEREIIEVLEREEQWRYENNRELNSDIGEKLAHKLRELEEEKMQLERERQEATDNQRRRHQEPTAETLRMNEENLRKQEEIIRKENEARQLELEKQLAEEKQLLEEKRIQEEREMRNVELRRKEELPIRIIEKNAPEIKAISPAPSSNGDEREVLRVERELLQLEQEELKRQRSNLAYREQKQQQLAEQLQEQWKSLQDVAQISSPPAPPRPPYAKPQAPINYRASMPNLQMQEAATVAAIGQRRRPPPPPIPPAKPLRLVEQRQRDVTIRNSRVPSADSIPQQVEAPLRPSRSVAALTNEQQQHQQAINAQQMSRQTLQALSAVPRPRMIQADQWVQRRKSDVPRGSDYNYQHWLIQEAEQRRISEKNQRTPPAHKPAHVTGTSVPYSVVSPPRVIESKPLPDSIIQTLTQRVQSRVQEKPSLSPRRRLEHSTSQEHLHSCHYQQQTPPKHHNQQPQQQQQKQSPQHQQQLKQQPQQQQPAPQQSKTQQSPSSNSETQEKMLSVSGKKKCSHCGDELGRGAAMIIESLRLFYHMECFKCCVCHVKLGDGLMGTDVRVRNHKLHCHNCYSSDDGVKFSCV